MFDESVNAATPVRYSMDEPTIETSENTADRGDSRQDDRVRWIEIPATRRTIRSLLALEGASFFLAAMIHAGVLIQEYEHREAMIAESVIGAVLLVGLLITRVRPRSIASIGAIVQAFALAGTCIGIWTMIVGVGPRTIPDIVYHAVIVVVLMGGLVVAWRARGTDTR
ncbi:hypothetical protein [Natronococcus wangiae]|uniref:hypothetical protein n=1 Tax=Natronococcus wangiae TaxID=3068275 RepID=UPI00273E73FE|nr:hypothetical protein [Natronococcus sp. AD5]